MAERKKRGAAKAPSVEPEKFVGGIYDVPPLARDWLRVVLDDAIKYEADYRQRYPLAPRLGEFRDAMTDNAILTHVLYAAGVSREADDDLGKELHAALQVLRWGPRLAAEIELRAAAERSKPKEHGEET